MEVKNKSGQTFIRSMLELADGPFIGHYGVLGMKWGVRNDRTTLRRKREAREDNTKLKPKSKRKTSSSSSSSVSLSSLSTEQIKDMILRIESERKLKSLLTPPPKTPSAGRVVINNAVKNAGGQLLTTALVGAGTYLLGAGAQKIGGEDLKNVIVKKK